MSVEPNYDLEMRLAPGLTCSDCAHVKRCVGFGFTTAADTSCDFWPSRFRAPPADGLLRATKAADAASDTTKHPSEGVK